MQVIVGILAVLGALAVGRFFLFLGWRRRWAHRRGWALPARRTWLLRRLFDRLETTPAQEKLVLEGAAALREDFAAARAEWDAARRELASLLGEEPLDLPRLEALIARPAEKLSAARARLVQTLASFHAALQASQRKALADLVREGHLAHAHGYRYRRC